MGSAVRDRKDYHPAWFPCPIPSLQPCWMRRERLPVERRDIFLQRCGAMLRMRGRFSDDDVRQVVELAACGLVQTADSAA